MDQDNPMVALAKRFTKAVADGDLDTMAELYAPEMRIWHNIYQKDMTGDEHLQRMKDNFFTKYLDRSYVDSRIIPLPNGFVQRHIFTAKLASGVSVEMPICLICDVADGKITRIEEYLTMRPEWQ